MTRRTTHNRGFTLIEILVVLAISMILMGLIMYPVVQSFQLTRRAQAMTDAQNSARIGMRLIGRELGEAMYVFDNSDSSVELPVPNGSGGTNWFKLPYAKIDMILPKLVMHCNNPDHPSTASRDYNRRDATSKIDFAWPPCQACIADGKNGEMIEARPRLPLQQDVTIVRYFLGLENNRLDTVNKGWVFPYGSRTESGTENQVVLYRLEIDPYDENLFPASTPAADRMAAINDPQFFYDPQYCDYLKHKARVIGIGKYEDLVIAKKTDDNDVVTAVEPTITFRTTAIDNDTFSGSYSTDKSFEYPDAVPALYSGKYGYWTPNFAVSLYRDDYNTIYATEWQGNELWVVRWTEASGDWTSTNVFNITQYESNGDLGSGLPEMAFTVDANRGVVQFAIDPFRAAPADWNAAFVGELNPVTLNDDFHDTYSVDPGSAKRKGALIVLASGETSRPRIVPGTERVIGPDMNPGAYYANPIRYERVPYNLGNVGLNQYKIDYDTGGIEFSPVYGQNIPETLYGSSTTINITYKVQFNEKDDIVRGDYSTKALVTIHMGMRMFDPDSGKAHPVDLNSSVKIRNALR